MVAWQPESGLSPSECDDLRIARYAVLMHSLQRCDELTPGWAVGIQFSPEYPNRPPAQVIALTTAAAEQVVAETIRSAEHQAVA